MRNCSTVVTSDVSARFNPLVTQVLGMMEATELLDGIVYEPTQTEGRGIDLTVAEIYEIEAPGRVDFGGGELEQAETSPHPSDRRNPDDEYEWWHLEPGQYLVEYNETVVPEDRIITVQPRTEILERGATHPTLQLPSLQQIPLAVGGAGIDIKENARVTTIVAVERAD